ncbi:MAG: hypothetical protein ACFFD1_03280 [Candidatus Thorarchaeota archaeon]
MKSKTKLLSIFIITAFSLSILGILASTDTVSQGTSTYDGQDITETPPIITYVGKNFDQSSIDGSPSDFTSKPYIIESKAHEMFYIYWENNGTDLHALISTTGTGFIALGWRADKPQGLGPAVMEGANIVIGQDYKNGTKLVRDDYGRVGQHDPDTSINGYNNIIYSDVVENSTSVTMEFVYPLITGDNATTQSGIHADVNLTIGGSAYFLMSASPDANTAVNGVPLMEYHGDDRHVISKPVYIQSSQGEDYPAALSATDNIISKPLPASPGFFDPLLNSINDILNNIISDKGLAGAVIPITAMAFFLIFIGGGFVYLVINARKQKWNVTSLIVPVAIIAIFVITIIMVPLPRIEDKTLPNSQVDVQIVISAQIKPWTYNVSVYQNKFFNESLTFVNPEDVYAGFGDALTQNQMLNSTIRNETNFAYITDPSYGGLKSPNITVFTGQTVRFVLEALDTEHGFLLGDEGNPVNDVFGDPLVKTLPQHALVEFYWKAPSTPTQIEYRCTFFCGAGHPTMHATLFVVNPPNKA